MTPLRHALEQQLTQIPSLTIDRWKDTHLICLNYHGREVAHFHAENILDLRLSPKIIRQEALSREVSARIHPKRSQNSRWIGVEFKDEAGVPAVARLVQQACYESI
ncbi:luciferase domain-containing protein [Falsiruegeria mediterranea]|uniref:Luciferase domain-containing protein n=1 Tax=Falsiruegeria mediterranea M17 TaxID=1200281 RepID=A0A2R8C2Y5_9RHOB|nr:luciferase family protein [Falsiruegeria mediterranea]SPJ26794.1 hypothetical protein TRM7615_00263 [Falsiruegeria mediterranea M17]